MRSVMTEGRDCLMFECCQCRDNLCLLIIEEYSIFPWGVLPQYSVFTSESGRVLLLPPSSAHQGAIIWLWYLLPVLRGGGCQDQRWLPGSSQPAGGGQGEAWGCSSQPSGRRSYDPHNEAHLGASHQVRQLNTRLLLLPLLVIKSSLQIGPDCNFKSFNYGVN